MAYDINDKAAAVTEVQKYLHEISRYDPGIPKVYPDGVYEGNTASAVSVFQRKHGLPETGTVDGETFGNLYREYLEALGKSSLPEKVDVFGCRLAGGKMSPGEEFDSVYILQVMLCVLAEFYGFGAVGINGRYDESTENAVRSFQKICGLPATGCVDRRTWDEIARAYNSCIRKEL